MTGKQLRAFRESLEMSQSDMAAALGLRHKSHVSYMESGRIRISGSEELAIRRLVKGQKEPSADPDDYPPEEVRRIRLALGMSLQQFAEALGLKTHAQAAHLERDATNRKGRAEPDNSPRHGRRWKHRSTRVNWAKAILLKELAGKIRQKKAKSA